MLRRIKGFHWNINQSNKTEEIPSFIIKEIETAKPAFACITEYSKEAKNSREFEKQADMLGYNVYSSNAAKGQKDVLILVDKQLNSKKVTEFLWNDLNEYPNYLEVCIKEQGFELTIVGTRIRVNYKGSVDQDRSFRINQMVNLNKRLSRINTPCVVLGDFNGLETWMKNNITTADYYLCRPNGDTFNFEKHSVAIDHAVVKGVKAKVHTSWAFTESLPEIYKDGPFSSNVPSPFPDHAQLICDIMIEDKTKRSIDEILDSKNSIDWKKVSTTMVPKEEALEEIKKVMPKGSEMHLKAKKKIEAELNITTGNGCTYPYVVRYIAKALSLIN